MFLNYTKNYFLKRILKNSLQNVKSNSSSLLIQTVGLVLDESCFHNKEVLIEELIANGISENNIKIIVYSNKLKKNAAYSQPTFSIKHLNWKAEIIDSNVNDFIHQKFDLLISYYDVEKAILLNITLHSKALFKVGFSSIDKRLNHLIINTDTQNYKVFVQELFRYLKILNKI